MHLSEVYAGGRFGLSIEIFPPKTEKGDAALRAELARLTSYEPAFVSCTYGAGGTTRDRSLGWCRELRDDFGQDVTAHFTCVGSATDDLAAWLTEAERAGVSNIMALRGDAPDGETWTPAPGGLRYANELVAFIRERFPDFGVGVAGYPEKHPECADPHTDLANLKRKVDAGADAVFTQLFFENDHFLRFRDAAAEAGIEVPIVPGVMPVTSFERIKRITAMCGSSFPPKLSSALEAVQDDPAGQFEAGGGVGGEAVPRPAAGGRAGHALLRAEQGRRDRADPGRPGPDPPRTPRRRLDWRAVRPPPAAPESRGGPPMSSPFPGMDPWLEAPGRWPDVHNAFAAEIRGLLNRSLPLGYKARLEERNELVAFDGDGLDGLDGDGSGGDGRLSVVDVAVVEEPGGGGLTTLPGVRTAVTPAAEVLASVPVRLLNVRVTNDDNELICLIEILSPANKRQNRREFLRKRLDLLRSPAGLVEIDLLRRGRRVCGDSEGGPPVRVPVGAAYMVLVSRPWERDGVNVRGSSFRWLAYFLRLADQLPVVPVPLREGEPDVPLDLQYCFTEMYDAGPFLREASRYDAPPDPPLPPAAAEWAAERVRAWRGAG